MPWELIKDKGAVPRLRKQDVSGWDPKLAVVRVSWVGMCRTDLLVADGVLEAHDGIVLGHECSGVVQSDPSGRFAPGALVAINPLLPGRLFMGLHTDGALRSLLPIDAAQLIDASTVEPMLAAYVEPVAASMAPLKARIGKHEHGVIFNANRISELTYRIMKSTGYSVEWIKAPADGSVHEVYDYAIETCFEDALISNMLKALKPGGVLVVKSRQGAPRQIVPAHLVAKELTLQAVNYHDFDIAMKWMRANTEQVKPLIGNSYALADWGLAFEEARSGEGKKVFIRVGS